MSKKLTNIISEEWENENARNRARNELPHGIKAAFTFAAIGIAGLGLGLTTYAAMKFPEYKNIISGSGVYLTSLLAFNGLGLNSSQGATLQDHVFYSARKNILRNFVLPGMLAAPLFFMDDIARYADKNIHVKAITDHVDRTSFSP